MALRLYLLCSSTFLPRICAHEGGNLCVELACLACGRKYLLAACEDSSLRLLCEVVWSSGSRVYLSCMEG
jgi:hypothetical protein